jgi:Rv2525c-like, glycoside hydrolase-like domain
VTGPVAVGIDYAWAQIPAPAAKAAGVDFVERYLGGSARITVPERDNLHAAGIAIILVWEQEADAAEKGFNRGVQAAQNANSEADAVGYPRDAVLLYADDKNDPDPAQEVDFMRGVRTVGGRPSDMYSGGNVLAALVAARLSYYGGQMVETWYPHSGADPFMVQLANTRDPIHIAGIPDDQFDTDLLYRAVPMWGANGLTVVGGDVPQTRKVVDGMWYVEKRDGGQSDQWWDDGPGGLIKLSQGEAYARLAAGVPHIEMPSLGIINLGLRRKKSLTDAIAGLSTGGGTAPTHFAGTVDLTAT